MDETHNYQSENKPKCDFALLSIFNNLSVTAMQIEHGAAHPCAAEPQSVSEVP